MCPSNEGADMGLYGLMSLGTFLQVNHHQVCLIDASIEDPVQKIMNFKPQLIGFTAMTTNLHKAIDAAKIIREKYDRPFVLGGTHISCLPESLPNEFDLGVIGEGEITFLEIIKLYKSKNRFSPADLLTIKGVCFHDDNKVKITAARELIKNLDVLPIPDRSLLSSSYFVEKQQSNSAIRQAGIMTSRGCPFKCSFCASSFFWDKTRVFSPERVAQEVEYLYRDFKINNFAVWDDMFTLNKKRIKEIGRLLDDKGLLGKVTFGGHARANRFDEETAELLQWLGFESVGFGFESGSDSLLARIKPGVRLSHNHNSVKIAKKYNFKVYSYLIIGNPNESLDDIRLTLNFMDFMLDHKVDCCMVFCALPFPGTKYWDIALKRNLVNDKVISSMTQNDIYKPIMLDETIDNKEYLKLANQIVAKSKLFGLTQRNSHMQLLVKSLRNPRMACNGALQLALRRLR